MPFLGRFSAGSIRARTEQAVATREAALRVAREADRLGGQDATGEVAGEVDRGWTSSPDPSQRICGAAGCTSGWMKPWKNRRRPVFEEDWVCGSRCLETLVAAAVRREFGIGSAADSEAPHRHRVPLGLVLLAQGWITHPQLQSALAAQRASGEGLIGDWLTKSCGLAEERIARGLGVQWNCPVLSLDGFSPRAMALVMPKRFVTEFGLVPIRIAGRSILYVAFQDRMQVAAALSLEQMSGLTVESGLLAATQLESARRSVLEAESVPVRIRLVNDADALTKSIAKLLEERQPVASRLVRLHQYHWLRIWLEEGAVTPVGVSPVSAEDIEDHIFMVA